MKLQDCTKAELLWVIEQAERHSLGNISYCIEMALVDLKHKREIDLMYQAKEQLEIANKSAMEYVEILKPYEGKKISEVPMDVLKKADSALKRSRIANRKWAKLMGIKMEDWHATTRNHPPRRKGAFHGHQEPRRGKTPECAGAGRWESGGKG